MSIGRWNVNGIMRFGSSRTEAKLNYEYLQQGQGSAYNTDPTSISSLENANIAKMISASASIPRRFKNNFNPMKMDLDTIIEKEQIYGIVPAINATIQSRRSTIAEKYKLLTEIPTLGNISKKLSNVLGNVFIQIETFDPSIYPLADGYFGSVPGGADFSAQGGPVYPNGPWTAIWSLIKVRVWQPRDKYNNYLMSNQNFLIAINSYQQELVNYLPSYMQFRTIYFTLQGPGTVSAPAFTSTITGVGTHFSQPFNPPTTYGVSVGHKIEIVDDLNFVNIFTIKSINSDTSLTVNELITHSITGCYYRIPSNTVSQ